MDIKISAETRRELLGALRTRYADCEKEVKAGILDEFVAVSGYHRKHAIRLLTGPAGDNVQLTPRPSA